MNTTFCNHSASVVSLKIDAGDPTYLQPNETRIVAVSSGEKMTVAVRRNCESEAVKDKSYYRLVVETEYVFENIAENAMFHITREKTPFSLTASYDRLFVETTDGDCANEKNHIVGEERMKEMFRRSKKRDILLDALMTSPLLTVCVVLIPIILTVIFGWKIGLIVLGAMLAFWAIVNVISNFLLGVLFNKVVGIPDEEKEFYGYFESNFITEYYSKHDRSPVYGEIETD